MGFPFDHITEYRDSRVAENAVLQLHRRHIWNYLEKIIPKLDNLDILELSKGSSEDAAWLSDSNFNVLATDVSEATLKATQQKSNQFSMQFNISSHYLDLDGLDDYLFTKQFDLIYSDIGSLNHVSPETLSRLFQKIKTILAPGGRFVAVFISPFCLSESLGNLLRLRFARALRRQRHDLVDDLNRHTPIHLFGPSTIERIARMNFEKVFFRPVGVIAASSGMINVFSRHRKLLNLLGRVERKVCSLSILTRVSDLFIVEVQN